MVDLHSHKVATNRYFIALLPPLPIQEQVNLIKQEFADRYASRKAFNSPPHITLQPPFELTDTQVEPLKAALFEFVQGRSAFSLKLDGFAAFPPRVVYIHVPKTEALSGCQTDLSQTCSETLGIVDARSRSRAFTPHMTVAFRDLTPANFRASWAEFCCRSFEAEFVASALTLLIHRDRCWQVAQEFSFALG